MVVFNRRIVIPRKFRIKMLRVAFSFLGLQYLQPLSKGFSKTDCHTV